MRAAITELDTEALLQAAHSMKSSGAMVGISALAEQMRALEVCGRSGDLQSALSLFAQAQPEYRCVKQAIENLLAKEAA